MKTLLKNIYRSLIWGLKSKYKWFIILFFLWLYRVDFLPETGEGIGKALQVVSIVLLTLLLYKHKSNLHKILLYKSTPAIASFCVFYVYGMVSTLWAYLPTFAFFLSYQNILIMGFFWCAFSLLRTGRSIERAAIYMIVMIELFEFIGSRIYNPSLFSHYLPLASSSAILLSYSVGEFVSEKTKDSERASLLRNIIILQVFFLIISTSGGANASAVIAVGIGLLFGKRKSFAIIPLGIGIVLFFHQDMIDDLLLYLNPGKNMEMIENGNGRDVIWARIDNLAKQKPILGWGFACVERVQQNIFGTQKLSDAHSNYVGTYGSLGILGCVLLGLHLMRTFCYMFKYIKIRGGLGVFCGFCCATINGYSYGFLSGKTCSITIVYIIMIVLTYYYAKRPWTNGNRVE